MPHPSVHRAASFSMRSEICHTCVWNAQRRSSCVSSAFHAYTLPIEPFAIPPGWPGGPVADAPPPLSHNLCPTRSGETGKTKVTAFLMADCLLCDTRTQAPQVSQCRRSPEAPRPSQVEAGPVLDSISTIAAARALLPRFPAYHRRRTDITTCGVPRARRIWDTAATRLLRPRIRASSRDTCAGSLVAYPDSIHKHIMRRKRSYKEDDGCLRSQILCWEG